MKAIHCYIKSFKQSDVIEELHTIEGLTGVSVIALSAGYGRERKKNEPVKIVDNTVDYVPHCKIEIICKDSLVEKVITAIQKGAHTGNREDGKIYLYPVEDAIRISNAERGDTAV